MANTMLMHSIALAKSVW